MIHLLTVDSASPGSENLIQEDIHEFRSRSIRVIFALGRGNEPTIDDLDFDATLGLL